MVESLGSEFFDSTDFCGLSLILPRIRQKWGEEPEMVGSGAADFYDLDRLGHFSQGVIHQQSHSVSGLFNCE
jgi:hypothetical protein